jgi:alpha-tubulin suppressor-like RCC1 family protein
MIVSSGHVECWGMNGSGQLGNGTTTRSSTPVEVQGVTDARQVSVGPGDVCAVLSSGHVDCWGDNTNGALGTGEQRFSSELPVEVPGIADAVQIAVGDNHACVVLLTGSVDCWGRKVIEAIDSPSYTPVEVPGIHNATQAAVGGSHSCALLSSGHVECWEENFYGELGIGSIRGASIAPVEVHGVMSAIQIAAGEHHTCALVSSGHIVCWGANEAGQLGDGTTALSDVATEVLGVENATQLAAGGSDSCALTSSARVECWGGNYTGQLDDGGIRGSDTPVQAHDLNGVAQLAVAGPFSCALWSNGAAACWGANDAGQLGDGVNGGERDEPIGVVGITDVRQVAIGWPHACAVLSDGQLDCWGENRSGELGDGTTERKEAPIAVPGVSGVRQVSAGEADSCAVLATGRVDCWGRGAWEVGQLGNGTYGGSLTPVEVENITTAIQVATETYGSCALLSDGHVECWGSDFGGSLGNGTRHEPSTTPVEVQNIADAIQIAAGEEHFCALLPSGHIDCWGGNGSGQLGDGTAGVSEVPVEVQGIGDATEVVAGYEHTCALLSTGHVDCWGLNANGQLGNGTNIGPKLCPETWVACSEVPLEVAGLSGVTKIAAGGNDSCALLSGGRAACWGGNESEQIGDGTFGPNGCESICNRERPTEVKGLTGATSIAIGGSPSFGSVGTACAVVSGGQLECWGSNRGGVLGDDLGWSTVPVGVVGFSAGVSAPPESPAPSSGSAEGAAAPSEQAPLKSTSVTGAGAPSGTRAPVQASVESTRAIGAGTAQTSLLSSAVTETRRGQLSLAVSCSQSRVPCTGTVSIVLVEHLKHHKSTSTVLLARARYTLRPVSSAEITVTLSPLARALLAQHTILHANVTITTFGRAEPARRTGRLMIRAAHRY